MASPTKLFHNFSLRVCDIYVFVQKLGHASPVLSRSPSYYKIAIALVGPLLRIADHTPKASLMKEVSSSHVRIVVASLMRVQKLLLGAGKDSILVAYDARLVAADFRS